MRPKFTHRTAIHNTYKRISPIFSIKSKRTASYFTLTLSLISLSFFGLFAIRPTIITAISLTKSVADLQKLNIDYENKISNLIRAQSEYEKIRDSFPLIDSALPSNATFSKLAQSVERFAKIEDITIHQMQIDSVSVSTLPTASKLYGFGFSLIGTGSYNSVTSFVSHLTNWRRIINIRSLEFAQEGSTISGTLRLTLKATAYYEP